MVNSSCLGWIKILIFCPSLMFWTELWPSGEPLELPWRLHQSEKVGPSGWDQFGFSWSDPEGWFFWIRFSLASAAASISASACRRCSSTQSQGCTSCWSEWAVGASTRRHLHPACASSRRDATPSRLPCFSVQAGVKVAFTHRGAGGCWRFPSGMLQFSWRKKRSSGISALAFQTRTGFRLHPCAPSPPGKRCFHSLQFAVSWQNSEKRHSKKEAAQILNGWNQKARVGGGGPGSGSRNQLRQTGELLSRLGKFGIET